MKDVRPHTLNLRKYLVEVFRSFFLKLINSVDSNLNDPFSMENQLFNYFTWILASVWNYYNLLKSQGVAWNIHFEQNKSNLIIEEMIYLIS